MSSIQTPLDLHGDFQLQDQFIAAAVNALVQQCHGANVKAGWWSGVGSSLSDSTKPQLYKLNRNVGELLMLCVSELSEAMEGDRKNLQDDKLPQYKMLHVELADALIRICDLAGAAGAPLGEILAAKMAFNASRIDHTLAHRMAPGGKQY